MRKRNLAILATFAVLLMVSLVSAEEVLIYDAIDDSVVNGTLWNNYTSSSGSGSASVTENTLEITVSASGTSTSSAQAFLDSIAFFNITEINEYVGNVTFKSDVDANAPCSSCNADAYIKVFGTTIWSDAVNFGGFGDDSTWTIAYDASAGNFKYYDDGSLTGGISLTDNNLSYKCGVSTSSGVGTSCTNRLEYVNYTLRRSTIPILSYPQNGFTSTNENITFNTTYKTPATGIRNFDLQNATLYIWDSNGALFNTSYFDISGQSNATSIEVQGFSADDYTWNVYACTDYDCAFNENNSSFIYGVTENNSTFNATTYETAGELITANVTLAPGLSLTSANLIYNGTAYGGTVTSIGGNDYRLSRTLQVPLVSSTMNQTFYWNLIFSSGFSQNLTTHTQEVKDWIINWTETNMILNITVRDEETNALVNSTTINTLTNYWYYTGDGSVYNIFTQSKEDDGTFAIGLSDASVEQLDADAHFWYVADGYNLRNYYSDFVFTNATSQEITLYLLLKDSGVINRYRIISGAGNLLADALVKAYKIDGAENTLVEMGESDDNGLANLFLDPDFQYQIVVTHDNCAESSQTLSAVSSDIQTITLNCNDEDTDYDDSLWQTYFNVTIIFSPSTPTIPQNNITTFMVNVTDQECLLSSLNFSILHNDIALNSTSSSNVCGASFSLPINVTQNGTLLSYVSVVKNGTAFSASYPYTIVNFADLVANSDKSFYEVLTEFSDFGDELGLSQNSKTFIAFLALFGILGTLSLGSGAKGESIAIIIFAMVYVGAMSFIGWFTVSFTPFAILNQYSIFLIVCLIGGSVIMTRTQT